MGFDGIGARLGDGDLQVVDAVVGELRLTGGHGRHDQTSECHELGPSRDLELDGPLAHPTYEATASSTES